MIFAQFYHWSAGVPRRLIPAVGDRAVLKLDGRRSMEWLHLKAATVGNQRGYTGYSLFRGHSFSSAQPIRREVYPTSGRLGTYDLPFPGETPT